MSRTFLAALAIGAVLGFGWAARAADETVATVGDKKITRAQLEDEVRAKLIEIENQRYDALREGLDGMVAQELLKREAAARGTTAEALTAEEIDKKTPEPSDQDIQKVYEENKSQLGGQTLEQVKPRIVQYLKGQKQEERRTAFIEELKKKYPTTVSLKPPVVNVAAAGRPERGGKNASVTSGRMLSGAQPFEKFKEVIDDELASSKKSS